ncbi:hypothetical protein, partial [Escherichia coli]|uniref:hypothetical protein n=1 Tax=Escherichia coli TaxID=562 RepID=UPI002A35EC19
QIFMPNLSPVSVLPVESLALVTTKNDAAFVDGMLVTHTANLPSQALGLVSLPARVLKGYFEAIGSILKLKIDTTKGETDMINELIGQIEAKKK